MAANASLTGAGLALAAFAVFAGYDTLAKVAGAGLPSMQVLFMASSFSLPAMLALAWWQGELGPIRPRHPWLMALRVAVILINGICVTYAFVELPLATCYAIFFTMPLMITVMAWPILHEPIDLWRGLAVAAGFAGVVIALDPAKETLRLAHLAAMTGAVMAAANYIIIRKIGRSERSFVLQVWPMLGQVAVLAPVMIWLAVPVGPAQIGVAALMGIAAVAGMALIIAAYAHAASIIVAPMQYSQILWAAFYGTMFFEESLNARMLIGMGVIIAAGMAILARPGARG